LSGLTLLNISRAVHCLQAGELIAYPTEAVFGLGCDPESETAVRKLLALKDRPAEAGLILIADRFERFDRYIQSPEAVQIERAMATWPGPVTWLFPRAESVPDWLAGNHATIALRVTAHPVCRALCAAFKGAMVSTSANPSQKEPARSVAEVDAYFGAALCGTVAGELGGGSRPSEIRDLATGRVLREA
jgi:L-threonylcarbamoyladenylate synthase